MPIDVDYPNLIENFRHHLAAGRSESASFLIWYLQQYYRLDSREAIDAVSDQGGDKGIDGIFINDSAQTITVFQSKITRKVNTSVGDAMLRDFLGTLQQFRSVESGTHLMNTSPNTHLEKLIRRSEILTKMGSYDLIGEYIINTNLDQNGINFLKQYGEDINFVGKEQLVDRHISSERNQPKNTIAKFKISDRTVATHYVNKDKFAIIAPLKALDLVQLDGIENQSLFDYNVRGPLGNTAVNRELTKSIRNANRHSNFPFFHNGVTIIAKTVEANDDELSIGGYYVVNGCQSITALHRNRKYITDDLSVLTKIIRMDPTSKEASEITEFSNNQNGVRSRDFKSNDQIQIRLQREFTKYYGGTYVFNIKRGDLTGAGKAISNEEAGLYLMAFDQREPWGTHRKYEVFEDRYTAIFARPEVTADRIVLLKVIDEEIVKQLPDLEIEVLRGYNLTRYIIMHILRTVLESDAIFEKILSRPSDYMREQSSLNTFRKAIHVFIAIIIVNFNVESEEFGDDFDYRRKLKDAEWVKALTKRIKLNFKVSLVSKRTDSFQEAWSKVDI